ncbi:DciA family protein [Hydrogenophaga sp.]|uniref:DciA family protein n=1 Tax=Hydrogenophaga sp. TaxID=1904254 RepID=UPI001984195C|nr:DciA family protein [Hydrogenophaga sp.]MBD3892442.1 hypothetical protein [Hydrogenophaga sp.]
MNTTPRSTFSLEQASEAAPALAALRQRVQESQRLLRLVQHLIPAALRPAVQAGPLLGSDWCLLVGSASASTKLRHLLPTLQAALRADGSPVQHIRIKVLLPKP